MAEIKCPVCQGKTGIPDYRVQDTVCQTCGADLSIYRLAHDIESVSDQSDGKKKGRLAWIIPAAIACLLVYRCRVRYSWGLEVYAKIAVSCCIDKFTTMALCQNMQGKAIIHFLRHLGSQNTILYVNMCIKNSVFRK